MFNKTYETIYMMFFCTVCVTFLIFHEIQTLEAVNVTLNCGKTEVFPAIASGIREVSYVFNSKLN